MARWWVRRFSPSTPRPIGSRHLRLRASVRTEGAIEAHLTLATRAASFNPRPIGTARRSRSAKWTPLAAEVDVPADSVSVSLELAAEGIGRACFGDLAPKT